MAEAAGLINVYVCEACGYRTVTKNRDEGTTPFMISCRRPAKCEGMATSTFYRGDQTLAPAFLWVKPTARELELYLADYEPNMQDQILEHVERGGLVDLIAS